MLHELSDIGHQEGTVRLRPAGVSLQAVLWALWVLAVAGAAFLNWRADIVAERPVDLLGLVIRTLLVGLVGLIVLTLIEMRLEPERFIDRG